MQHKLNKKKKVILSMQATICMLSINLENTKKELDEYKKYSYDINSASSDHTIMAKLEMDNSLS